MKRTISILLLAALICGTVSCGSSENSEDDVNTTSSDSASGETTTADNSPDIGLPEDLKYDGYTFTFYGRGDMENKFIADDELVEITPKSIRVRKRHLKEHERKRASREG